MAWTNFSGIRYSRTSVSVKDGSTPFTFCLLNLETT